MHTSWQSSIGGGFCFPRPSARNRTMHMHVSTAAAPAQAASAGVADALPALARLFFSELLQLFEGLLPWIVRRVFLGWSAPRRETRKRCTATASLTGHTGSSAARVLPAHPNTSIARGRQRRSSAHITGRQWLCTFFSCFGPCSQRGGAERPGRAAARSRPSKEDAADHLRGHAWAGAVGVSHLSIHTRGTTFISSMCPCVCM